MLDSEWKDLLEQIRENILYEINKPINEKVILKRISNYIENICDKYGR